MIDSRELVAVIIYQNKISKQKHCEDGGHKLRGIGTHRHRVATYLRYHVTYEVGTHQRLFHFPFRSLILLLSYGGIRGEQR